MKREPKALRDSDLFYDAPDEARALWAKGYRPTEARKVRPAMTVAYRVTDVFRFGAVGSVLFGRVERVQDDGRGTILVWHTGGCTDADELSEVWARPNDDPAYAHWEEA